MSNTTSLVILLLIAGIVSPTLARADVVSVWNRGNRIRLEGKDAEPISGIVADMMAHNTGGEGAPSTHDIQTARQQEVVVEVEFDQAREFPVGDRTKPVKPQYLLVLLSGIDAGTSGNDAHIAAGRKKQNGDDVPMFRYFERHNPPDEYGIVYYDLFTTPSSLAPLRVAVDKLGVDAPPPTP